MLIWKRDMKESTPLLWKGEACIFGTAYGRNSTEF